MRYHASFLVVVLAVPSCWGWHVVSRRIQPRKSSFGHDDANTLLPTVIADKKIDPYQQQGVNQQQSISSSSRRTLLQSTLVIAGLLGGLSLAPSDSHAETVRAIGGGEQACREAGNCLQVGEWDGAVGWHWGGEDRCDPTDPLCGSDGKLRQEPLVGKPVPEPVAVITHVAAFEIDVGRGETGVLRIGLYGNDCPGSVGELVDFFSKGLTTMEPDQNTLGASTMPVALATGGVLDAITPGATIDFGVPSQSNAYGRSTGISRVKGFVPQPRPSPKLVANDAVVCSHKSAGLVSVPLKGLGYGGSGFEQEDEAFESAFLITADAVPSLDSNRRVVGQILDARSMAFLERLASLPTKKGIKGVIPGLNTGPPLLKVTVRTVEVSKVANPAGN